MIPLNITSRDTQLTATTNELIRNHVDKLEHVFPRVTACNVIVVAPSGHHKKGSDWDVHIQLRVPGKSLVVDHAGENPQLVTAIHDAFQAAKRQLTDYAKMLHSH